MLRVLTHNLVWKLLSLLISVALWILLEAERQRATANVAAHNVAVRTSQAPVPERLEPMISRDLPVQVQLVGAPAHGWRLASVSVEPDRLRVLGPQHAIGSVEMASTQRIVIEGIKADEEFSVGVFVGDPQVRFETPPQVLVRVQVQKRK